MTAVYRFAFILLWMGCGESAYPPSIIDFSPLNQSIDDTSRAQLKVGSTIRCVAFAPLNPQLYIDATRCKPTPMERTPCTALLETKNSTSSVNRTQMKVTPDMAWDHFQFRCFAWNSLGKAVSKKLTFYITQGHRVNYIYFTPEHQSSYGGLQNQAHLKQIMVGSTLYCEATGYLSLLINIETTRCKPVPEGRTPCTALSDTGYSESHYFYTELKVTLNMAGYYYLFRCDAMEEDGETQSKSMTLYVNGNPFIMDFSVHNQSASEAVFKQIKVGTTIRCSAVGGPNLKVHIYRSIIKCVVDNSQECNSKLLIKGNDTVQYKVTEGMAWNRYNFTCSAKSKYGKEQKTLTFKIIGGST